MTGQIIAGVVLGPSVLGAIAPGPWHGLFPDVAAQRAMLDGVSQLAILLLLLMPGIGTDFCVFRDARRSAISISLGGILAPFVCGCILGQLLPASLLPDPGKRLITTLFLGTALSISSVKVVALVVRDLGFLRRTVGQVIIASAVVDDTIGWVIMSLTFGLARRGVIDLAALTVSLGGTALFLLLSFTVGRQLVFRLIRFSNDTFSSEMATVTTILVIAGLLALLTNAIGVHFVLGTFVAGILIGQSPILTRQLSAQVRGLTIGLFMPIFFTLAGFTADLPALANARFLALTAGLIALASLGKFFGAFAGGRMGGLSYAESFAVGCGMNARGSTEVIVASIGLQTAVLSHELYTAILVMAITTTTAMPPMMRWAFSRLPVRREEQERLERQELEARGFLSQVERLLVAVDPSPSGRLASRLAGLLAGARGAPTTVLQMNAPQVVSAEGPAEDSTTLVKAAAAGGIGTARGPEDVEVTTRMDDRTTAHEAIAAEADKGYGLLVIGREPAASGDRFDPQIARSAASSDGAFAITIARGRHRRQSAAAPLKVLVPVSGTRVARHGAEVAISLARASRGSVTAVHAVSSGERNPLWRRRPGGLEPRSSSDAAVREVRELGRHYDVAVHVTTRRASSAPRAILRELARGGHDLLVMGVTPRLGEQLFFGELAAQVLKSAACSLLFVCAEPMPESAARS
ncbi:MAG: cation:proton antiporter [Gammaproteobacteria bacterium]|nr:cation:proton antiporter [Gammaproteobacteria bacterium]